MSTCTSCGSRVAEASRFCSSCGTAVVAGDELATIEFVDSPPRQSGRASSGSAARISNPKTPSSSAACWPKVDFFRDGCWPGAIASLRCLAGAAWAKCIGRMT